MKVGLTFQDSDRTVILTDVKEWRHDIESDRWIFIYGKGRPVIFDDVKSVEVVDNLHYNIVREKPKFPIKKGDICLARNELGHGWELIQFDCVMQNILRFFSTEDRCYSYLYALPQILNGTILCDFIEYVNAFLKKDVKIAGQIAVKDICKYDISDVR